MQGGHGRDEWHAQPLGMEHGMSEARRAAAAREMQRLEREWRDGTSRDEGWFDATIPCAPNTPPWPGDTPMSCGWTMRLADGESVNLSTITMSPHVGTHADAPLHVRDGGRASDSLPVPHFNGLVHVVDVRDLTGAITLSLLGERLQVTEPMRVFLRTGASVAEGRFPLSWAWLDDSAAAALAIRGLRLLGTDAPSVDARDSKTLLTHHACFDHGASVLENVDLRDVSPGTYELRALPMRLQGLDAAPVRALLRPVS
jgi:arylformamidase